MSHIQLENEMLQGLVDDPSISAETKIELQKHIIRNLQNNPISENGSDEDPAEDSESTQHDIGRIRKKKNFPLG